MAINPTLANRLRNRKLPNVDPPEIEGNPALREFADSVKEHLRMYEGDSGAPKERFVTIEELESAGLVGVTVKNNFAAISDILGQPVLVANAAEGSSTFITQTGATTFQDLDDTSVDGISGGQGVVWNGTDFVPVELPLFAIKDGKKYDLIFRDTTEWIHTDQLLQWNPDLKFLQLANAHAINWLDLSETTREFINFESDGGGGAELQHFFSQADTEQSTNSVGFIDVAGSAISGLTVGDEYLVISNLAQRPSSEAKLDYEVRILNNNVEVLGSLSHKAMKFGSVDSHGHPHQFVGRMTGTSGDIKMQFGFEAGSGTHFVMFARMIAINVTQLGSNFIDSEDLSAVNCQDSGWSTTGTASITFGDGVSDYMVFIGYRTDDPAGSPYCLVGLDDGATVREIGAPAGFGSSPDIRVFSYMEVFEAPSSQTLTVQGRTAAGSGQTYKLTRAYICAIRLDVFQQHATVKTLIPEFPPGAGVFDYLDIPAFNITADTGNWAVFGGQTQRWTSSGFSGKMELVADINAGGDVNAAWTVAYTYEAAQNTIFDKPSFAIFPTADLAITKSDSVQFTFEHTAAPSVSDNEIFRGSLTAFSWRLAQGVETFNVGNTGFRTDLLGTAIHILPNSTLTVAIDVANGLRIFGPGGAGDAQRNFHSGTDFLTTFLSVDKWNISGMNSVRIIPTSSEAALMLDGAIGDAITPYLSIENIGTDVDRRAFAFNEGAQTDNNDQIYLEIDFSEAVEDDKAIFWGTDTGARTILHRMTLGGDHNFSDGFLRFDYAGVLIDTLTSGLDFEMGDALGDRLMLFGPRDISTSYGLGIEAGTLYSKANTRYRWYVNSDADGGTSDIMELDASTLTVNANLVVGGSLSAADAAGPQLLNVAASATIPNIISNKADPNTGVGWVAADAFSAIAGGREAVRYSEASAEILVDDSTHTGITAGTTQTQADGFQLLSSHNEVLVVANTNDTVVAPLAAVGRVLTILNNGANTMQIFPAVGDDIGAGIDTVITLVAGGKLFFRAYDATTWTQFV